MIANTQLFTLGNFQFRLHHLLIIGILAISFSISFLIRSQAADYGFELNEFDPYFNFRATQYIVDNGFGEYFDWHDDMSWYPLGRNVSATSQVMLHITAATLYQIFGGEGELYDFTIIFPVVFGSLTAIVVFALVRVIGGTTAGLFASLFFAISVPIIVRGTIGWFKSEPLGLFYGLLGVYFFLSGIKSNNRKIAAAKLVGGGILLSFGLASWGGIQFFIIPLGFFILALPFLRNDRNFLIWAVPVFTASLLLTTSLFERPGIPFITGLGGLSIIGPTAFLVVCIIIQKFSKEEKRIRNGLGFLGATIIAGIVVILSDAVSAGSFRYQNAIFPFLTTSNPLVDSVAEHATTTTAQSFYFLQVFMIFAGIGVWLIFRNQSKENNSSSKLDNDMISFALIIGFIGVYISSAFIRLEVFASISVIILASLGLSIITKEMFKKRENIGKKLITSSKPIIKISYVIILIAILLVPLSLPGKANWVEGVKAPPTILNGGTTYDMATNDWPDALEWIKNNTPEDAVIASWWDYGYWITTLGERTTLADNATIYHDQIKKIAQMFLSPPDLAWQQLKDTGADYVLVYVAAQRLTNEGEEPVFYVLQGGADESKKQWFMRIGGFDETQFLHQDGISATENFWQNTLLGNMFPYSTLGYLNFANSQQSETFRLGYSPIYGKDIKYPSDGNGPLKLVYSSPSFERSTPGVISGIFIYEFNKDYDPSTVQKTSTPIMTEPVSGDIAIITSSFGDITIKLRDDLAPNTVANFKNLVNAGFYDGTLFHRIVPNFVTQGGDPNTVAGSRDTWGQGGPGYSIKAELSDVKHVKNIVSMARAADIDSGGSQFFIVLGDAPWLDGKYTVFGEVIDGIDVVEKIEALETNSLDQPVIAENAIMQKIVIATIP